MTRSRKLGFSGLIAACLGMAGSADSTVTVASSMTVTGAGGVGVTYGIAAATGTFTGNIAVGTTTFLDGTTLLVSTSGTRSELRFFTGSTGGTNADGLTVFADSSSGGMWWYEGRNLLFGTSNSNRITVTSSGDVGISTTAPAARLAVNGAIVATGLITSQTGFSGSGASLTDLPVEFNEYLYFTHPHFIFSASTPSLSASSGTYLYGQSVFDNAVSSETNCAGYVTTVPEDLDSAVTMTVARYKFTLGGADTGTHRYVIAYKETTDSAVPSSDPVNPSGGINIDFGGDGSGASGDVETVSNVSLTGWASGLTAGRHLTIFVCRDGNATEDASTVDSTAGPLVIKYGRTQ